MDHVQNTATENPITENRAIGNPETAIYASVRRAVRYPCSGEAQLIDEESGAVLVGSIRDMCAMGCMVHTRARKLLVPGTHVHLFFTLHKNRYSVAAVVRNSRPGQEIGLQFEFADDRERAVFNQLFYQIQQ